MSNLICSVAFAATATVEVQQTPAIEVFNLLYVHSPVHGAITCNWLQEQKKPPLFANSPLFTSSVSTHSPTTTCEPTELVIAVMTDRVYFNTRYEECEDLII
jgi:hypothetical protein